MSSTSDALVQLAEQKEALRQIANRYLDSTDRLPVDCTLQDIIDVLNEYDEYSYMNAFLNSIEVFPDKDYSINDTKGHIKGLRPYGLAYNTALKSLKLTGITAFTDHCCLVDTNLEFVEAPMVQYCYGYALIDSKVKVLNFPKLLTVYDRSLPSATLELLLGGRVNSINGANLPYLNMKALILTNQTIISTIANAAYASNLANNSKVIIYVPSVLVTQYQSATNWSVINNVRSIQDIESHINSLRELGADFSYTPYANKRWDGTQLIEDTTIGEEVDE